MQKRISIEDLKTLQYNVNRIRNVCILAHVDHGKTSLADSLISSNGIISKRLVGTLRYLDSRSDEQLKGITMKSSAISLLHTLDQDEEYLVNIIDSPGHVDFASEVSTAVRLSDGAIIVIDVVEGICPQTQAVLKQSLLEKIKPIIVLNKLDKLILDLKLSPLEAYFHLRKIVEHANAIAAMFIAFDQVLKVELGIDLKEVEFDGTDDNVYFSPVLGNVVFASAIDGWSFSINEFANLYSKKMGFHKSSLQQTLWDDYYISTKQNRILKNAVSKGKSPLFVQLILSNIWYLYDAVIISKDKEKTNRIVKFLELKLSLRETQQKNQRVVVKSLMSQWLPLSNALLNMVCSQIPSPNKLPSDRIEILLNFQNIPNKAMHEEIFLLKPNLRKCDKNSTSLIVFVSKMFPFNAKNLPENRRQELSPEDRQLKRQMYLDKQASKDACAFSNICSVNDTAMSEELANETVFIAFARVMSGSLKVGDNILVLGPKHNPRNALLKDCSIAPVGCDISNIPSGIHITQAKIQSLYLIMGKELEMTSEVPAGNLVGIRGLHMHILNSATLSNTVACPSFVSGTTNSLPIMRVAIEPSKPSDITQFIEGLKLLNQADPCVEVKFQETGETLLLVSGEVHLERCVFDLEELYANCKVTCSEPIVPFRETIIEPPKIDMVNEDIVKSTNLAKEYLGILPGKFKIRILALPLPNAVTEFIYESSSVINIICSLISGEFELSVLSEAQVNVISAFQLRLGEIMQGIGEPWSKAYKNIWAFGPRYIGPNVLVNNFESYERPSIWKQIKDVEITLRDYDQSIIQGFQLATSSGNLCEEPLMGVCIFVKEWIDLTLVSQSGFDVEISDTDSGSFSSRSTNVCTSGQLISFFKEACLRAISLQPMRLMTAIYKCDILATTDVLGKVYAVLSKRRGKILNEELKDQINTYLIHASLPVPESFGFVKEIRKRTSGLAHPQLVFSHWETLMLDPAWVPTTEEEILHFGEQADSENYSLMWLNKIRARKGLAVEKKLVEFGEKQRTLSKKK